LVLSLQRTSTSKLVHLQSSRSIAAEANTDLLLTHVGRKQDGQIVTPLPRTAKVTILMLKTSIVNGMDLTLSTCR
jgi:hypothetical protein